MINQAERACYRFLMEQGNLSKEKLERVYNDSVKSKTSFSDLLVKSGLIDEPGLLKIYSERFAAPCVNLKTLEVDKAAVDRVPVKFGSYYRFFPVKVQNGKLTVAVSRPLDVNTLDEIRLGLGCEISMVFAPQDDIEEMLKRNYGVAADTVEKIMTQSPKTAAAAASSSKVKEIENIEDLADTASVVQLVNQIILDAYKKGASDVHIEPCGKKVRLRYRIDGVLQEARVPADMQRFSMSILSRIKIMADLNIVERRLPQDGKARVKTQDQNLDLRISSIPTAHGEGIVIRILPSKMVIRLEQLGFDAEELRKFQSIISRPHGVIFVTGPTGSGKSTTLYAALQTLNKTEQKIITIEDPVEYDVDGLNQIQVNPEIGLTFARGLRSVLRHDPDILMIGEVRDLETADIAIRAALTGHLIFSTLHTNDAASGVTRLLEIGVEPYLVASSVVAFIAQRLIRTICPHCREEDQESLPEIKQVILKDLNWDAQREIKIFKGRGCDRCNQTGFRGRSAIHEVLPINEEIRKMIFAQASAEALKKVAMQNGMKTLRQDGWEKVLQGVTTPDEVIKVTPANEHAEGAMPVRSLTELEDSIAQLDDDRTAISERRKYPRVSVRFQVSFQVVKLEGDEVKVRESKDHSEKRGETEDMSASGIKLLTEYELSPGDLLDLKIEIPDNRGPVQCIGRVLRVTRYVEGLIPEGKYGFKAGILFLAINSADRARIEQYCQS